MPCEIILSIPQTQSALGAAPLPEPEAGTEVTPASFRQALHAVASAHEVAEELRRAGEFGIAPITTVGREGQASTVFVNRAYVVAINDLPEPGTSPAERGPSSVA